MFKAAKSHLSFGIIILSLLLSVSSQATGQLDSENLARAKELNRRAVQLISQNRLDAASPLLEKAIALYPQLSDAHMNLGTVLYLTGQPETGVQYIKKGLELEPDSHIGYNQLGVVYDKLGQRDLAIDALKKAVELKPDYAFGYYNLGKAYLFANRLKHAEAALEKGLKLDPSNNDGKLHLAALYAKQERFSDAIALAKDVTKKQPNNDNANLILCKIYVLANDRESALGMYQSFKATNVSLADEMFRSIFQNKVLQVSR